MVQLRIVMAVGNDVGGCRLSCILKPFIPFLVGNEMYCSTFNFYTVS